MPLRCALPPTCPTPTTGSQAECTRLTGLFRAVALAGALAGCGGGGSSPPPPPPPAPAPQGVPAQLTVPPPLGYDADHLAAFNRLNELRLAAGLGMLWQNVALDQAAQAHADWEVANNAFSHYETAGTPGFTGVSWTDRASAAGYSPSYGGEAIATGGLADADVDSLINAIYHRYGLFQFELNDIGVGWSSAVSVAGSHQLVLDIGIPADGSARSQGQRPQVSIQGVCIWPLNGATGVSTLMGNEEPNPIPTENVLDLGMPASVETAGGTAIAVQSFSITDESTGQIVPAKLLTAAVDSNHILTTNFAALIPTARLSPQTKYLVQFSGSETSSSNEPTNLISRIWEFTTAPY